MSPFLLFPGVLVLALAYLLALYAVHLRTRDAGIVDFGWACGVGLAALVCAALAEGDPIRRVFLAIVAGLWSFRLASYILRERVLKGDEDARYANLRVHWGAQANRGFLMIFLANGVLIGLFAIPFLAVASYVEPTGAWAYAGLVVGLGAIWGERLSDAQLAAWKANPDNRGKTCRAGLWRYSRHPNYFFEWLHWWAYVLLSAPSWRMLPALLGPLVMLVFLYRVTGIPYTELQAIKSRGDDYRAYQETTSAFFPWFPKPHP